MLSGGQHHKGTAKLLQKTVAVPEKKCTKERAEKVGEGNSVADDVLYNVKVCANGKQIHN